MGHRRSHGGGVKRAKGLQVATSGGRAAKPGPARPARGLVLQGAGRVAPQVSACVFRHRLESKLVPVLQPACEPKREVTTAGAKEVTKLLRTVLDMPSGTIQIVVRDSWLLDLRACHANTSSPKSKKKKNGRQGKLPAEECAAVWGKGAAARGTGIDADCGLDEATRRWRTADRVRVQRSKPESIGLLISDSRQPCDVWSLTGDQRRRVGSPSRQRTVIIWSD